VSTESVGAGNNRGSVGVGGAGSSSTVVVVNGGEGGESQLKANALLKLGNTCHRLMSYLITPNYVFPDVVVVLSGSGGGNGGNGGSFGGKGSTDEEGSKGKAPSVPTNCSSTPICYGRSSRVGGKWPNNYTLPSSVCNVPSWAKKCSHEGAVRITLSDSLPHAHASSSSQSPDVSTELSHASVSDVSPSPSMNNKHDAKNSFKNETKKDTKKETPKISQKKRDIFTGMFECYVCTCCTS
jgi:hypothetical protein